MALAQVTCSCSALSSLFSPATVTLVGHPQYPPQSAPTQVLPGISNFVDGSGPIFSMYVEMASEEDKKMAEGWKADADGILIFVRHYLPVPRTASQAHQFTSYRPVYSLLLSRP